MESIDPSVPSPSAAEASTAPTVDFGLYDDGFLLGLTPPPVPLEDPSSTEKKQEEDAAETGLSAAPAETITQSATAESEPLAESEAVSQPEAIRIPDRMYFRIGDVSELVGVKPYVLRYWETEFPMISPQKSNTGQRVYRRVDVETVLLIKHLLYRERYSIEGARKRIQELRREGQLKSFKRAKVLGGEQAVAQLEKFKKAREIAHELHDLVHLPMRELFRY